MNNLGCKKIPLLQLKNEVTKRNKKPQKLCFQ
jgi:hypothetical protein